MRFFGKPKMQFHDYGPHTATVPERTGYGGKVFVIAGHPVAHSITPAGNLIRQINVHPERQTLPVEQAVLEKAHALDMPGHWTLPESDLDYDRPSEQFHWPNSRPGGVATQANSGRERIGLDQVDWPSWHPTSPMIETFARPRPGGGPPQKRPVGGEEPFPGFGGRGWDPTEGRF